MKSINSFNLSILKVVGIKESIYNFDAYEVLESEYFCNNSNNLGLDPNVSNMWAIWLTFVHKR